MSVVQTRRQCEDCGERGRVLAVGALPVCGVLVQADTSALPCVHARKQVTQRPQVPPHTGLIFMTFSSAVHSVFYILHGSVVLILCKIAPM